MFEDHEESDHDVTSNVPYKRAKQILARHLCGWISGHGAPIEHFLIDADMILEEMHNNGIRFHLTGETGNSLDGFTSSTGFYYEL